MRSTSTRLRGLLSDPRFKVFVALVVLTIAGRALLPSRSVPERTAVLSPLPTAIADRAVVVRDSLAAGETLSEVWERNSRARQEMAGVVEAANVVFDVRQLRAGTAIELYPRDPAAPAGVPLTGEEPPGLDSVLIRIDADRTLAVRAAAADFRGELRETPVREVLRTHVGCIEGSLYAALTTAPTATRPAGEDFSLLALELDRIYGGVMDFYTDLQPGDCVSLVFQTFVRPDGSFRLGRIESAEFVNEGTRRAAIWFQAPDGTADYYDLEGKSLKRQFLRSPLKFTRISSGFTLRRFHPILRRYRAHPGIDYAAPAGTPVQAAGNGVVTFAGWKRGYGKTVELRHGKVYATSYAHLSRIPGGIRRGARVSQGQIIGHVGSTGLSTGPHLDYRFTKNGKFVNPLDQRLPTSEPVAPEYASLFADRRDREMRRLGERYRTMFAAGEGLGPGGQGGSPLSAGADD